MRILSAARKVALDYASWLPNFLCTETVRRSVSQGRNFAPVDTLTVEVGYYERQEAYRLVEVNAAPVEMRYDDARGTISRGEFGSVMRTIFTPASAAEFHFERWTTELGRRAATYSFRVDRSKANYEITAQLNGKTLRERVGLRGEAVIDCDTYGILRLHYMSESVSLSFPIRRTNVTVEYGESEIGGKSYLLPLKATVEMQGNLRIAKNEVTFHSYRKFSAESGIRFEDPQPQP
jgi:hypothetical protein